MKKYSTVQCSQYLLLAGGRAGGGGRRLAATASHCDHDATAQLQASTVVTSTGKEEAVECRLVTFHIMRSGRKPCTVSDRGTLAHNHYTHPCTVYVRSTKTKKKKKKKKGRGVMPWHTDTTGMESAGQISRLGDLERKKKKKR